MLGVAAQRIAWPIRKPRNNADECHCAETRRDGAFRAICVVAHLIPESLRRGHAGLIQRFLSGIRPAPHQVADFYLPRFRRFAPSVSIPFLSFIKPSIWSA